MFGYASTRSATTIAWGCGDDAGRKTKKYLATSVTFAKWRCTKTSKQTTQRQQGRSPTLAKGEEKAAPRGGNASLHDRGAARAYLAGSD